MLACSGRMGFRIFAMEMNTGFILMFLNPAYQMPFNKNFKINIKGIVTFSYWMVLMICFVSGIAMDDDGGAYAVSSVFLLNTHGGLDITAISHTPWTIELRLSGGIPLGCG